MLVTIKHYLKTNFPNTYCEDFVDFVTEYTDDVTAPDAFFITGESDVAYYDSTDWGFVEIMDDAFEEWEWLNQEEHICDEDCDHEEEEEQDDLDLLLASFTDEEEEEEEDWDCN